MSKALISKETPPPRPPGQRTASRGTETPQICLYFPAAAGAGVGYRMTLPTPQTTPDLPTPQHPRPGRRRGTRLRRRFPRSRQPCRGPAALRSDAARASSSCPRIWTRLWWIWGCSLTLVQCSTRRTASWMSLMGTWSDASGLSEATDCGVTPSGPGLGLSVPAWPQLGNRRSPGIPSLRLGSFYSIFPYSSASLHPRGRGAGPGPTAAGQGRGHAEGSPGKFIKHLKWVMTRCMDQVMERNYTLKCEDDKKDKGTRRAVIRPCQW